MRRGVCGVFAIFAAALIAPSASARVLRVGTYKGIPGQYSSIQAAVDAAQPGDWILVGPGDYKTTPRRAPPAVADTPAGVLITTPRVYLRGMNRNTVIVDGTKPGPACSRAEPTRTSVRERRAGTRGLNGIMVWKADDVWVQNLTACNFLSGKGDAGNEIWWNGGDGSGKIGGHGYYGSYLSATSTFYAGRDDRRRSTGSSPATGPAAPGTRRTPATSATPATTSAPASRCATRRSTTRWARVQRARLLGDQLRRSARHQELASSTTTRTGSTPTARTATTRPRRRTARVRTTASARSPTPTRAGCSWTTTSTTTTTPTCRRRARRRPVRSAPGCRSPAGATTRSWTTGSWTTAPGE